MAAYRKRRAAGSDDPFGDVFLVVDGWPTLRGEYDDLEPLVTDLADPRSGLRRARRSPPRPRWIDFRPAIRDLFGARLELRLGDPTDSMISRKAAGRTCPTTRPAGA